jgi:hypothetical protein
MSLSCLTLQLCCNQLCEHEYEHCMCYFFNEEVCCTKKRLTCLLPWSYWCVSGELISVPWETLVGHRTILWYGDSVFVKWNNAFITPQLGQEKCMRFVRAIGMVHDLCSKSSYFLGGGGVTGWSWDEIYIWQKSLRSQCVKHISVLLQKACAWMCPHGPHAQKFYIITDWLILWHRLCLM